MMLNLILSHSVLLLGEERGRSGFLSQFTDDMLARVKCLVEQGYDPLGGYLRRAALDAAHHALGLEFADREFEFHYLMLQLQQELNLYIVVDVRPDRHDLRSAHVRHLYDHYLTTPTYH